jgi:hypothetical protein
MHDVVGQLILGLAVVFAPAAEENDGKAVFRKSPDDLVDPARDAAPEQKTSNSNIQLKTGKAS